VPQQGIGRRIPDRVVHAVEEPGEIFQPSLNHAVETAAKLRRLDFLSVTRAHGRDPVGKEDAAFQQADLGVVFDAVDVV